MGGNDVIILDTHIWIWWITKHEKLTNKNLNLIEKYRYQGLGISMISCWEIAKLVEKNRLQFQCSVEEWLNSAMKYPDIKILDLTLPIILQSTKLDGFHQDPADQIIVATAMVYDCPLITQDSKILKYPSVKILSD
nr:type II toxin-antitoxin system VapC family toxin [Cyanobacterium sp. IPPAS B-1200]